MEVSDNIEVEPFEPLNESGSQRPDVTARPFFKCDLCAKSFRNRLGLERHIKNKHPKAPVCFGCLKSFSSVSNMKRHSKLCKGKPTSDQGHQGYQCLKCGKIFPSTSGLRKHVAASCSDAARPRKVHCRECNPPEIFSNRVELGHHKKAVHSKKWLSDTQAHLPTVNRTNPGPSPPTHPGCLTLILPTAFPIR